MPNDDYRVIVFPGDTIKPRKYKLPKILIPACLFSVTLFLLGISGTIYYFSTGYFKLKSETAQLADLRRETKLQKIQVEKFSQQVRNFETEMSRLARFEKKLRTITALENSPKSLEKNWGVGGPYGLSSHSFVTSLEKESSAMVNRLSTDLDLLSNQARIQSISFQELDEYFKNQSSMLASIPSIWPIRGWVTSGFGFRKSPFTGLREKHEGLDIAARTGSPVRSPADGIVVVVGKEYGYGL